ncbi:MAG: energy transducer TonB [Acidobacteriota bacterium]|nr:energy transducer TonB [Acidobacteriota bacterium]
MPHTLTTLFKLAPLACACLLVALCPPARAQAGPGASRVDLRQLDDLLWKGHAALERRDDKGALEIFRDAVTRFPDATDAWYGLGVALRRGGGLDESISAFARALKLRGASATVSADLAYALMLAGRRDEAKKESGRAFPDAAKGDDPHYLAALLELNHAYPDAGAPQRALEEAEASLASDADFAPSHLLKSQALVRLSASLPLPEERAAAGRRMEEAAQSLEKFLALSRGAADYAFWQQQLSALRAQGEALRAPDAARAVFFFKEITTRAAVTNKREPLYTEEARHTQTFGSVRVQMILSADGSVQHPLAINCLPNGLTESAVEAARTIQFTPATKDGRTVSQFVTVVYNFNVF